MPLESKNMSLDPIDLEFMNLELQELEDVGLERLREEIHRSLDKQSARELAYYFIRGNEDARTMYRDYLGTRSDVFKAEFRGHLDDPFLGEREGDDF